MPKPNVSRSYGCPGCGGMVPFSTKSCSFCGYKITIADRYEWADDWVRVSLYVASVLVGAWIGNFLFYTSKPLLAMMIAVVISFWYLYRLVPSQYQVFHLKRKDTSCAG